MSWCVCHCDVTSSHNCTAGVTSAPEQLFDLVLLLQGRSSLWWHLLSYQEREHFKRRAALNDNAADPALANPGAHATNFPFVVYYVPFSILQFISCIIFLDQWIIIQ